MLGLGRQVTLFRSHPRTDVCAAFHDTLVSEAVPSEPRARVFQRRELSAEMNYLYPFSAATHSVQDESLCLVTFLPFHHDF